MREVVLFAAVLAIASPNLAFAGEAKKAAAPAIKAIQMSDAEMDNVTAGAPGFTTGLGNTTASDQIGYVPGFNGQTVGTSNAAQQVPNPGHLAGGVCTAGVGACP